MTSTEIDAPSMKTPLRHYPVMVLEDRYGGAYSGGRWLAIAKADEFEGGESRASAVMFAGPSGGDIDAMEFWRSPPDWIATAATPNEAVRALVRKRPAPNPEPLP